jgi:hypothetical protein
MERPTGAPRPYLANSVTEETLVANSEQRLHSVLATLEECQTVLVANASQETAQLVSLAILQLRMRLNRIADSELKVLCDAMMADQGPAEKPVRAEKSHVAISPQAQRRTSSAPLKLVK